MEEVHDAMSAALAQIRKPKIDYGRFTQYQS